MKAKPLHTIGYEKVGFPAFVETLLAAGVRHVIDVRDLPLSRRAGFSKTALANGLAEAGIGYTHAKALGTPPEGRAANKRRQWPEFWQIVDARLETTEAQLALQRAIILAAESPSALLCYEADPCTCHRLRVGQLMCEAHDFDLVHLTVPTL